MSLAIILWQSVTRALGWVWRATRAHPQAAALGVVAGVIASLALDAHVLRGRLADAERRERERERLVRVLGAQAKVVRTEYRERVETLTVHTTAAAKVDTLWRTVTVAARDPHLAPAQAAEVLPRVVAAGDAQQRACALVRQDCAAALRLADQRHALDSAALAAVAIPPPAAPRSCKGAFWAGAAVGAAAGGGAVAGGAAVARARGRALD